VPGNSDIQFTSDPLIPAPHLCAEYGINRRTLSRWLDDAGLGLPKPIRIRGRLYFSKLLIEAWLHKRRMVNPGTRGVKAGQDTLSGQ
jgi:predicted DNA-binding transcriptional regulator AlpA